MEFIESVPFATTVTKAIWTSFFYLYLNRVTMDKTDVCEVVEGIIVGRDNSGQGVEMKSVDQKHKTLPGNSLAVQ